MIMIINIYSYNKTKRHKDRQVFIKEHIKKMNTKINPLKDFLLNMKKKSTQNIYFFSPTHKQIF